MGIVGAGEDSRESRKRLDMPGPVSEKQPGIIKEIQFFPLTLAHGV